MVVSYCNQLVWQKCKDSEETSSTLGLPDYGKNGYQEIGAPQGYDAGRGKTENLGTIGEELAMSWRKIDSWSDDLV